MIYLHNGSKPRLPEIWSEALIIKPEEKRQYARVDLRTDLRYQPRGLAAQFANAVSNNVSLGGIGLDVDRFLAPSTILNLDIDLLSRVLHPIGRVAWCQPLAHSDRNSLGVEFIEFNFIEKSILADFIKMQSGQL